MFPSRPQHSVCATAISYLKRPGCTYLFCMWSARACACMRTDDVCGIDACAFFSQDHPPQPRTTCRSSRHDCIPYGLHIAGMHQICKFDKAEICPGYAQHGGVLNKRRRRQPGWCTTRLLRHERGVCEESGGQFTQQAGGDHAAPKNTVTQTDRQKAEFCAGHTKWWRRNLAFLSVPFDLAYRAKTKEPLPSITRPRAPHRVVCPPFPFPSRARLQ